MTLKNLFPLCFLLPWTLFAEEKPAVPPQKSPNPEANSKSASDKPRQGIVFKLEGKKATHYLCGSIHLMREEDYPLPEAYEEAFSRASKVIFEIPPSELKNPESAAKLLKSALLENGYLADHLSEETMKVLKEWCTETETPYFIFAKLKPWMVGMTISILAYQKMGFREELGTEAHFEKRMKKSPKKAEGLETIELQIGFLESLGKTHGEEMVKQAIEEYQEVTESVAELIKAWQDGDPDRLGELMTKSFKEFPEVEKVLLLDRNEAWIKPLEEAFEDENPVMVLVGAGHLCGKGSVIDLLKAKGWKIEQVKAPAKAEATEPKQ